MIPSLCQMRLVNRIGQERNRVWAEYGIEPTAVEVPQWVLDMHECHDAIAIHGLKVLHSDRQDNIIIFFLPVT